MSDTQIIGIVRGDAGLIEQRRMLGDDIHQLLPGAPDIGARQLVTRSGPFRQHLAQTILDFAHVERGALAKTAFSFQCLDLILARGPFRLRYACCVLTALSQQFGARTFEFAHPGLRHKPTIRDRF